MVNAQDIVARIAGVWIQVKSTTIIHGQPNNMDSGIGANPVGVLTYHKEGFMTTNVMTTNATQRPEGVSYPPRPGQTDSDWALVGRHTLQYAGPFTVTPDTETTGKITHGPLMVSNIPNWVGTSQVRNYEILEDGNAMHFFISQEGLGSMDIWWKRWQPASECA